MRRMCWNKRVYLLVDIVKQICYGTDSICRICDGARGGASGFALNSNTCGKCFFYILELVRSLFRCSAAGVIHFLNQQFNNFLSVTNIRHSI